ncbi:protein STICHEL-like 3 isoform X2 [Cucurbita moschata]|uniref:Protein STICHEL-like 3 isoform X2 n=1 Tax=Cucurbita moschata TaxID=3662 RepID=A0A6J1EF94_CUCMO|nr:protein STICHEL-like 3 isoform X2 [Cucurbita moschata]
MGAVHDRVLKEANGDISDHLRNHIHLTNCIHLKNHMHKHSPILADRSLMRDLIVLQRSRSLRDPSASPPSWQSPSLTDLPPRVGENNAVIREGRRSVGTESRRVGRTMSGSSPLSGSFATSNVIPADMNVGTYRVTAVSEHSVKSEIQDGRRIRREELSRRSVGNSVLDGNEESSPVQDAHLLHEIISRKSESKDRSEQKDKQVKGIPFKKLSEQLISAPIHSEDIASSSANVYGRRSQQEKFIDEPEPSFHGNCSGLDRVKRRKFRATRRSHMNLTSRDTGVHNELSVASNTLAHGSSHSKHKMEEENENYANKNVMGAPGNGCGMPWNWSRIHHRGKTFLDMAGRSFSCGLSDSMLRKCSPTAHGNCISDTSIASDNSSSSAKFDAEALPLLVEASGSQESIENAGWQQDYSGELGIFADNYVEHEDDSDLASEARCSNRRRTQGHYPRSGHQNLTQKYMPRTFKGLVGQNLVAQALSNAVLKKKVGLLYVFYGPHGTGKTSCARIFARALNCQSLEHSKPCGLCNSCIGDDVGKSRNIREVVPASNLDFESINELLDHMIASRLPSQYTVFIFYDCDSFSSNCWSAITKVIDRAPRRLVFVFVCSSPDVLPHIIISRCQKFFFPKLKDADIIRTLQWIATQENLEIDKDALKLIASRSDGSLRDAEMTLEQLSLLGQRISVPLIQELVGLISDEKLVDLLDLALSADTVNTVKNLRLIIESGVEPMALMSQIATVITDILAGSYDFKKERPRRKFFRRQPLSKEDMDKLRQALRTLSEAEKQLRTSNDKVTWLTAALLQLAPDQQYMLSSSAETSFNHSPLALNNVNGRGLGFRNAEIPQKGLSTDLYDNRMAEGISLDKKRHSGVGVAPQQTIASADDLIKSSGKQVSGKDIEEIWLEVLGKIRRNSIKEFFIQEGKLASVSSGAAPTVRLIFNSHHAKSKAEKLREQIVQAFESALGSSVIIEFRCELKNHSSVTLPASKNGLLHIRDMSSCEPQAQLSHYGSGEVGRGEIVEIDALPRVAYNQIESNHRNLEGSQGEVSVSRRNSTMSSISETREGGAQSQSQSIVRSKVSLAHVIQQAEGCSQRNGRSKHKTVSIAEELEQENLRLEPQSRSLLCWKASRVTQRKLSRLKIRTRRPQSLLKFVSCGNCLSA